MNRIVATVLAMALMIMGCSGPGVIVTATRGSDSHDREPALVKHVMVRVGFEPDTRPGAVGPAAVIQPLVHSGLTVLDGDYVRHPVLAETVPSLENGLWTLFTDGRMQTTWRLKDGARWQDGVPVTTEDLIFSLEVGQDKQMLAFGVSVYRSIEDATALDARTLVVTWKEPFIEADALFQGAPSTSTLLPRHLLEDAYRTDKATFLDLPFWTQDYIGAGPYQVRQWDQGIGVSLGAVSQYVLGRPKIDTIDVKYMGTEAGFAGLLAGTVDVTNNVGSISLDLQLREQWREGTARFNLGARERLALFPQFVDARPAIVTDVRFRRALTHAIDRQEIVDTLAGGLSPVAHSFLNPNQPQYQEIEANLPRYEFDPRRAGELLQELGYTRGTDGMHHDATGQPIELEIRSSPGDQGGKPATAIADYWQRLGVAATFMPMSVPQFADLEYRATFPSFMVDIGRNDLRGVQDLYSSAARLPNNNFRVTGGGNPSRYMNAQLDALLDSYFRALPISERTEALGKIIYQVADDVTLIGLFYNPMPGAVSNRVVNVSQQWPGAFITWNAYEWDVKP